MYVKYYPGSINEITTEKESLMFPITASGSTKGVVLIYLHKTNCQAIFLIKTVQRTNIDQ